MSMRLKLLLSTAQTTSSVQCLTCRMSETSRRCHAAVFVAPNMPQLSLGQDKMPEILGSWLLYSIQRTSRFETHSARDPPID